MLSLSGGLVPFTCQKLRIYCSQTFSKGSIAHNHYKLKTDFQDFSGSRSQFSGFLVLLIVIEINRKINSVVEAKT